jgi:putative FmdB family regulatory protein
MPAYDYDCAACGRRFEVVHGLHADRPTSCALCGGGPIRKAISAPAIHYKGSGWAKKERSVASSKKGSSDATDTADDATSGSKPASPPADPATKPSEPAPKTAAPTGKAD